MYLTNTSLREMTRGYHQLEVTTCSQDVSRCDLKFGDFVPGSDPSEKKCPDFWAT